MNYRRTLRNILFGMALLVLGVAFWDLGKIAQHRLWLSSHLLTLPMSPKKAKELEEFGKQTFTYLDQGSTHKVFASEDGKVVLKLFLDQTYESKSRRFIPILNRLAEKRKKLKMDVEKFRSCLNAQTLLPEETGMLYYHLAPTDHWNKQITLIDQKGEKTVLDLDQGVYFIQKKAVNAGDYILNCVAANDLNKARDAIHNLLEFSTSLYKQGIVLVDLQFTSNFGFIEDSPVRIDIEHLCFKESWKHEYRAHLEEQLQDFRDWIQENCPPSLLNFFDEEVISSVRF